MKTSKARPPASDSAATAKVKTTAKLFKTGRSQAVRLPKEFRFEGTEVLIRRVGNGVLLEPQGVVDVEEWLRKLDEFRSEPFMTEGRNQPPMPPPRETFE